MDLQQKNKQTKQTHTQNPQKLYKDKNKTSKENKNKQQVVLLFIGSYKRPVTSDFQGQMKLSATSDPKGEITSDQVEVHRHGCIPVQSHT